MKKIFIVQLIFLTMIMGSTILFANQYTQPVDAGEIHWNKGYITATGYGLAPANAFSQQQSSLMSREAAIADALATLTGIVKGININSKSTVEDHILIKKHIETSIDAYIRGASISDISYEDDGSCQVTMSLLLNGNNGLVNLIDQQGSMSAVSQPPLHIKKDPPVRKHNIRKKPGKDNKTKPSPADRSMSLQNSKDYTGIIIDASGLGIKPSIFPRIISTNGFVIYGTEHIDRDWLITYGAAGYAYNVSSALTDERTGKNPLIIKAVSSKGKKNTDVVISDEDKYKVVRLKDLLQQCRIVFVIGN